METFHFNLVLRSWSQSFIEILGHTTFISKMFHQMFDRPFRRCQARLPFLLLSIKKKNHLHESTYRTEFS